MIFIIDSPKYGKFEVLIDDEDWEEVKKYKWHIAKKKKSSTTYVYRHMKKNNKYTTITLHKHLTGYKITDHINGNGLDCRRKNMRECTNAENVRNVGLTSANTSGYKGVKIYKGKYITAQIRFNGDLIHLGTFETKELAAIAYNAAALKYHGEFANINQIGATK